MTLIFYPKSHRYKLDGEWVPGVTTITNVLDKSSPLIKWASGLIAEYVAGNRDAIEHLYAMGETAMIAALKQIPDDAKKQAQDRGTEFHDYAERISRGEQVDVPEDQVPLVESALAFMSEWEIQPVLVEACVGSRDNKYAGKADLIADHAKGPRGIFDWKSGKRIYDTAAWQLNAYGHAEFYTDGQGGDEHEMADLGIKEAYGVHIRADGYDVYPLRYGPDVYAEWLIIRQAFDINKRARGDWKVPGSGYVGAAIQHSLEAEW